MTSLTNDLKAISSDLKALAKQIDSLAKSSGKTKIAKRSTTKARLTVKKKTASAASSRKTRISGNTEKAIQIIKRHTKGIDVNTLKKKTGFDDKKISNIVHRAFKKGLIKRVGRGIYKAV